MRSTKINNGGFFLFFGEPQPNFFIFFWAADVHISLFKDHKNKNTFINTRKLID